MTPTGGKPHRSMAEPSCGSACGRRSAPMAMCGPSSSRGPSTAVCRDASTAASSLASDPRVCRPTAEPVFEGCGAAYRAPCRRRYSESWPGGQFGRVELGRRWSVSQPIAGPTDIDRVFQPSAQSQVRAGRRTAAAGCGRRRYGAVQVPSAIARARPGERRGRVGSSRVSPRAVPRREGGAPSLLIAVLRSPAGCT